MRNIKLLFTLFSLLLIGTGGLFAQPANDLCADAITFAPGDVVTVNTSTANGTGSPGTCETFVGANDPGVWYTISGFNGLLSATTCLAGTTYDTKLTVWSGACGALTCVTGNDDNCGPFLFRSTISWSASSDETYYVYVSGFAGATGTAEIEFSGVAVEAPSSGDLGYFIDSDGAVLNRIDLASGDTTVVGDLSTTLGFPIGAEIVDGVLYVTDADNNNTLYSIDTATAEVTEIAPVSGGVGNFIPVISEDPTSGTVYMVDFDVQVTMSNLYTIDLATGVATLVGSNTGVGAIMAFAINDEGRAFGIDVTSNQVFEFSLADFSTIGSNPIEDALGNAVNIAFGQAIDFDCSDEGNILFGTFTDFNTGPRYGALDPETGTFIDISSPVNGGTQIAAFSTACAQEPVEFGDGYTVDLTAITNVNLTLDGDCEGKLTARMVLVGDYDTDDTDSIADPAPNEVFAIVVQDSDPSNGPIVDGCGTYVWTATPAVPDSILSGFTTAWGYVNAEDKTSPVLVDSLEGPSGLYCTEFDDININDLPSSVSRCWIQDGRSNQTLESSMSPALRAKLLAGGGVPDFFDGCSDVEICVNDVVTNNGQCEDLVITRVFTATDGISCESVSGEENPAAVYSYNIVFGVPSAADVVGVDSVSVFSCSGSFPVLEANVHGDQNPAPNAEDFPYLLRANGPAYLNNNGFCNLGAAFQDGPRIITCPNTYKFVRTFTVIDWCDVNNIRTFTQLVKVGDFEAPVIAAPTQDRNFDGVADQGPLFYSTNTPNCESVFIIPAGSASDNCDAAPVVSAVIYPEGDTLVAGFGPYAVGAATAGIPEGDHVIRYTAVDACGNISTLDVDFTVGDETAPVAICEDALNVSIGGPIDVNGGTAQLCAEDVNGASYDDCTDIDLLVRVTKVNGVELPSNDPLTVFQECHTLTCEQLGTIEVELLVIDDANRDGVHEYGIDNHNTCWLDVLVEDKLPPVCIAPAPVTVTCSDLNQGFPQDLNTEFANDPVATAALLDAQFGHATGLDNCPNPVVTQTVIDNRNSCGVGTINRTFTVTDAQSFTSAPGCFQVITVLGVHDYTVVFPGDVGSDDCIEPNYNAVTFTEYGCDLITVSTSIDTFTATADECYKLRITYEVLNWCEYNTINPAYVIPRDADNDDNLEEITVLHVIPFDDGNADDVAYLDRDENRNNGFINELDTGDGGVLPGSNVQGYGLDLSRGAFIYHQFIKVYDNTPPTLTVIPEDDVCDLDGDCIATAELEFTVSDECSPESVNATAELDANIHTGTYTLADFVADADISASIVNNDGNFTVSVADAPVGRHAVRVRATDGCGNTSVDLIIFDVIDCKAPTPICINGLTATLMPDGNGGGMAAIWASDFIASPSYDCSGEVKFAIYRDGEQPASPSPADTGLQLTCADEGPVAIRIYAIDPFGQSDYCLTMLLVQAFAPSVCSGSDDNALAGSVATPGAEMMNGVAVNISNTGMNNTEYTTNGLYAFTGLAAGEDYTIEPAYNPSVNLGNVSTGDLIMISRHILDINTLTGDYQVLAADVNQDNNINILDIISIRRVILGLDAAFPATNSWRFYVAGDANHAETYTENNLAGNITGVDFVAVEMGNVSDAHANFTGNAEARSNANIVVEDVLVSAGQEVTVNLAGDFAGFQGTVELAAGVEALAVNAVNANATAFNLEQLASGLIAFSDMSGEGFSLELRATTDVQLSDVLKLSNRITTAEAYTNNGVANLGINFTDATVATADFSLAQNTPNPVVDVTKINFNLPTAATATLSVQDVQGRVVLVREIEAAAGVNSIELTTAQLGVTGVLTYTLTAGDFTATRKMVVVK